VEGGGGKRVGEGLWLQVRTIPPWRVRRGTRSVSDGAKPPDGVSGYGHPITEPFVNVEVAVDLAGQAVRDVDVDTLFAHQSDESGQAGNIDGIVESTP